MLLVADRRGSAAVEFSLLLPVFALLLVGTIDFGGVVFTKFQLNSAVTAGANYALVNATSVSSSSGTSLASSIAGMMGIGGTSTTATIVVNNGPTATRSSGATSTGGTASNADSCYCPTVSGTTVTWGSAQTCGASCASGGGIAGKFVSIVAQQTYTPSFSNYSIVSNNTITSRVVVQAQ